MYYCISLITINPHQPRQISLSNFHHPNLCMITTSEMTTHTLDNVGISLFLYCRLIFLLENLVLFFLEIYLILSITQKQHTNSHNVPPKVLIIGRCQVPPTFFLFIYRILILNPL